MRCSVSKTVRVLAAMGAFGPALAGEPAPTRLAKETGPSRHGVAEAPVPPSPMAPAPARATGPHGERWAGPLSHQHHGHAREAVEDREHCQPGVYRTEIRNFRGVGFVARKHPYLPPHHTLSRAGNPHHVSHRARPSYDSHYTGYYVGGGGSLFNGGGFRHRRKEGTWGWDYQGWGLKRRVQLLFSRGRLDQDGDAQYQQDHTEEIPNVFGIKYGEAAHRLLGREERGNHE